MMGALMAVACAPRGTLVGNVQYELEQTGKAAANFEPKVVGKLVERLQRRPTLGIDFAIVNAENAAHGFGQPASARGEALQA